MKKKLILFFVCLSFFCLHADEKKVFTIAVIPDTQGYSRYNNQAINNGSKKLKAADIWYEQMQFLKDNASSNGGYIDYAIHLGDLVECRSTFKSEWDIADKAMSIINGVIPFTVVPGNHDYDMWYQKLLPTRHIVSINGSKTFTKYFGSESKFFKDKEFYKDSYNGGLSNFSLVKAGEQEIGILGMEINPNDECLAWAQSIMDEHKNIPIIYVTHSYILSSPKDSLSLSIKDLNIGEINTGNVLIESMNIDSFSIDSFDLKSFGLSCFTLNSLNIGSLKVDVPQSEFNDENYRKKKGGNKPEEVWEKFISKNKQIFLVLCGHVLGEGKRVDVNDDGFKVYTLLSDYQGRKESLKDPKKAVFIGDGWLRFLTFDLENNKMDIQTYSTYFDKYENDLDSNFSIALDWNERFQVE